MFSPFLVILYDYLNSAGETDLSNSLLLFEDSNEKEIFIRSVRILKCLGSANSIADFSITLSGIILLYVGTSKFSFLILMYRLILQNTLIILQIRTNKQMSLSAYKHLFIQHVTIFIHPVALWGHYGEL